ncbi:MAG: CBO0543 family protein [Sporolactobacillus sp.]
MPKNLTFIEYYATTAVSIIIQLITDYILECICDLYGYFVPGADWKTLLIIFFLYPPMNLIFLNFYPFIFKFFRKLIYILSFSAFATVYEWWTVKMHVFHYYHWKLWYSAVLYPFIFVTLILSLKLVQKIISLSNIQNNKS